MPSCSRACGVGTLPLVRAPRRAARAPARLGSRRRPVACPHVMIFALSPCGGGYLQWRAARGGRAACSHLAPCALSSAAGRRRLRAGALVLGGVVVRALRLAWSCCSHATRRARSIRARMAAATSYESWRDLASDLVRGLPHGAAAGSSTGHFALGCLVARFACAAARAGLHSGRGEPCAPLPASVTAAAAVRCAPRRALVCRML